MGHSQIWLDFQCVEDILLDWLLNALFWSPGCSNIVPGMLEVLFSSAAREGHIPFRIFWPARYRDCHSLVIALLLPASFVDCRVPPLCMAGLFYLARYLVGAEVTASGHKHRRRIFT